MKKIILIVITCFIIQVDYIYSQTNYVSFQDSCIWSVNTHKYMTYSDTIINGKNYLKVYYHSENVPFEFDMEKASYFCAIRNDTTNKKVYGVYYKPTYVIYEGDFYSGSYKEYLSADTTEFLLYDFSLQISDTVTIASFEHDIDKIILLIAQRDTSMYIWYYDDNVYIDKHISNKDSLMQLDNGETAKRILIDFSLNGRYNIGKQMWIEGIGGSSGIFTHADYPESTGDIPPRNLICFQKQNNVAYKTEIKALDKEEDCFSYGSVNTMEHAVLKKDIIMFPNPAKNTLFIDFSKNENILPCEGLIINTLGQELQQFRLQNTYTKIDIKDFHRGLYFFQLKKQNRVIQTNKIIIE